jgi:alpha-tubulin suppressor-like RCC1 family protein
MSTPFRFKNADNTTVDFEDYYVRADYFRSGNLWVRGANGYGGLGDNTIVRKSSPVQTIAWGSNWKSVTTGRFHTAAIKTDGTLWTWGRNNNSQLGDNTTANKSSPVQTIAFGTNWKQVSAGNSNTAGIKTDGTLWTWGANANGQLGDNTIVAKSSPVQTITFGTNWMQVSSGYVNLFMAAIKTDGTLWTWGANATYGQLGDNTVAPKSSPVQTVAFGTNWKQVTSGGFHCAATKTDGTLWGWGRNDSGQLGDNTVAPKSSPVQTVAFGTNWKQVSCGYTHTAAIKTDGTLWVWGSNANGALGDNTTTSRSSPVQTVTGGNNWKIVACGYRNTAAVKTDGTLWAWGHNNNGQLGDSSVTSRSSPIQSIMYGTNWKEVSSGAAQIVAIQYQDDYQ